MGLYKQEDSLGEYLEQIILFSVVIQVFIRVWWDGGLIVFKLIGNSLEVVVSFQEVINESLN